MDPRTEVAWFLIVELLIGSPMTSLYRVIADLDLGDDVVGGLDHGLQQWTLSLGATVTPSEEKVTTCMNAINDKLLYTVANGFNDDAVTAAMSKLDFQVSNLNTKNEHPSKSVGCMDETSVGTC